MNDWKTYAQSRAAIAPGSGAQPSVSEYLSIKLADNWIAVVVVCVMLVFAIAGVATLCLGGAEVVKSSVWFFDAAKLCLGVFLGLLTGGKK
ncbi:hypothetical protein OO306_00620 [Pseudomonas sp. DCB_AW]|uniref:hypothetical protein n=1 Tax=Pseudomonas sp. DCB_AW TaxID=2993596 RepID=UPI00224954AC|nr:hypothetical protein [Pseudomonas sp. DCB_AW]MCX2684049.1 hypothetical protein [Pseudomonas sp. DCB_AW]